MSIVLALATLAIGDVPLFTVPPPPGYTRVFADSAVLAAGHRICIRARKGTVTNIACDRDGDGDIDFEEPGSGPVVMNDTGDLVVRSNVGLVGLRGATRSVIDPSTDMVPVRLNPSGHVLFVDSPIGSTATRVFFDKGAGPVLVAQANVAIASLAVTPSTIHSFGLTDSGKIVVSFLSTAGREVVIEGDEAGTRFVFDPPPLIPEPPQGTVTGVSNGVAVGAGGHLWAFIDVQVLSSSETRLGYAPPGSVFGAVGPASIFGNLSIFGVDGAGNMLGDVNNGGVQLIQPSGSQQPIVQSGDSIAGLSGTVDVVVGRGITVDGQVLVELTTTNAAATVRWRSGPGLDLIWASNVPTVIDGVGRTTLGFNNAAFSLAPGGDFVCEHFPETGQSFLVASFQAFTGPPPPTGLVVNSLGDLPQSGTPDSCDTGGTASNGDPECTLRAAIEVANARDEASIIHFDLPSADPIELSSALPAIAVSIEIAADDGELVEIRPAATAGSGDGLTLNGATATLRNIALRNFSGDGVRATSDPLTIAGCVLTDNGGWGAHGDPGRVVVEGVTARRSELARNGAGGLLGVGDAAPQIMLGSADVHDNIGAGVVSNSQISIAASTVRANQGPGVAVLLGSGPVPVNAVSIAVGGDGSDTDISANQGDGIYTLRGGVSLKSPATINGNGGWGVNTFGALSIGDFPVVQSYRMTVSRNGTGGSCFLIGIDVDAIEHTATACGGGGLFSPFVGTAGSANIVASMDIVDNAGPGVLAGGPITLAAVDVSRNAGPGVKRALVVDAAVNSEQGVLVGLDSTINDNAGAGIDVLIGTVTIQVATEINGNHGAGIRALSDVRLATAGDGALGRTVISANGTGTCVDWDITPSDEGVPNGVACELGGIVTPDHHVYAHSVDVIDNEGAGITAETVELHATKICRNSGEALVVSGTRTLDNVDTCGGPGGTIEPPPTEPPADDGGGCSAVTLPRSVPSSALLFVVFLALARARARRTLTAA